MLPGLTIFLGALLLFLVQPLLGKYLLPWFGGGPGVWGASLLFFQSVLLLGYLYAHVVTTRLKLRAQALLHLALLGAALCFLPLAPTAPPAHGADAAPLLHIVLWLARTVGGPTLVLATTSPLLQRWLALATGGPAPWRLYALSNVGSLLALVGYPLVIEPLFGRDTQRWIWSGGFVLFAVLAGVCAWRAARSSPARAGAREPEVAVGAPVAEVETVDARPRPGLWLALPAVASLLLVAVTSKLTLDVAPMPLLWVLPLALYLLTFVLCFDHPRWYRREIFLPLLAASGVAVALALFAGAAVPLGVQLSVYPAALFIAGMVCHGEACRVRPGAARLTQFYLCLAAGGALGTVCGAVLAPWLLRDTYELQLGLCAAGVLAGVVLWSEPPSPRTRGTARLTWLGSAALAGAFYLIAMQRGDYRLIAATRNFYGTLRVVEHNANHPDGGILELSHGVTAHGAQFEAPARAHVLTTYFGLGSGVGLTLQNFKVGKPRHIGVVGLGAGTLAAYGQPVDTFTFYEIDPAVIRFAANPFTFLKTSAAKIEIKPGDARLTLAGQAQRGKLQDFDILVLDAFSSDAIPVHLLTSEAMALYLSHLKRDGVIAIHISSRYLDLRGVVAGLAQHFQLEYRFVDDVPPSANAWLTASRWAILSRDPALRKAAVFAGKAPADEKFTPLLWTDDRASLLQVLR